MAASRKPSTNDKSPLGFLVRRIAPGSIRLWVSTIPTREGQVELDIRTREIVTAFISSSADQAVAEALEFLETPDDDPIVPHWTKVNRMARVAVEQLLHEHHARHMAEAAKAKIAGDERNAGVHFDLADAFMAAIEELDYVPTDKDGVRVPETPLAAAPIKPTAPRTKPRVTPPEPPAIPAKKP